MKNFEKEGEVQTFTCPVGGVTGGLAYQIGQAVGLATKTITAAAAVAGEKVELLVRGVVTIVKAASQAWTEGELVYWDDANSCFTTDATGNRLAGWATEVAASGASLTIGHVYLDAVARENEAT